MRKQLLIKYIEDKVSGEEQLTVHRWLRADRRNMNYFSELKNIMVMQGMSECGPASLEDSLKADGIYGRKRGVKRFLLSISLWRRSS